MIPEDTGSQIVSLPRQGYLVFWVPSWAQTVSKYAMVASRLKRMVLWLLCFTSAYSYEII